MNLDSLARLNSLIKKLSYREGDFTLASGKKSNVYLDVKVTALHPEGADLIGRLIFEAVRKTTLRIEAVGGLTLGADPLATAVSLAAFREKEIWPAFIVRKEPKDHGTGKFIEGTENLRAGASVLVLEDTLTSGGSCLKAVERLREAGYNPVAVFTVVDREQGGREAVEKQGLKLFSLTTMKQVQAAS